MTSEQGTENYRKGDIRFLAKLMEATVEIRLLRTGTLAERGASITLSYGGMKAVDYDERGHTPSHALVRILNWMERVARSDVAVHLPTKGELFRVPLARGWRYRLVFSEGGHGSIRHRRVGYESWYSRDGLPTRCECSIADWVRWRQDLRIEVLDKGRSEDAG